MISLRELLACEAALDDGPTDCARRQRTREAKRLVKITKALRDFQDTDPACIEDIPEFWPFVTKNGPPSSSGGRHNP